MGQLITPHAALPIVTTAIAIAVFLGLAIYVITCNPHRPISWVFIFLCLTIASIYLHSLFMASEPGVPSFISDFLVRWKWAAITISSTLYLNLVFFYFPSTLQRRRFGILLLAYLLSAGLALAILFTNLLVAGHVYDPNHHIAHPLPGPFMAFYVGFFVLEILGGAVGLVYSYHLSSSSSFRHQITYLLMPTGLVLLSSIVQWLTILTQTTDQIPHEFPDTLLILAAILYARAVVSYGSFVGRPLAQRDLFYSTLATVTGLAILFLTVRLDQWLMNYILLPYYLVTSLFVLIVATGFPTINHWITDRLDKWFFQTERQQQRLANHLAEVLAEASDPAQLHVELLDTLCTVLEVDNGYVALTPSTLSPDKLVVQMVQGNLPLQPGDLIRRPPLHSKEPQLVAALLPQPQTEPGWQDIGLFCPLTIEENLGGVLALGEKRGQKPFLLCELLFCAELIKELDSIGRMMRLRAHRDHYLAAGQLLYQTLHQLGEEVVSSSQALTTWETPTPPLEIRILGPLQVTRHGQLIPEAEWGSEKARALLAYLLWKNPAGASRDELLQALWPKRSVAEAANVFHVTLHHLRRVLQPEVRHASTSAYIQYDGGRYHFSPDTPHWLDVETFQALVASDDPLALRMALELYRGPYLEDVAWALPAEVEVQRRKLEQLYADALRRLIAQTNKREALLYLEKLLVIEPVDEMAHRALTLGYLARGRGDLARRQVARWQQALIELDLEPSPEIKTLWQMVETRTGVASIAQL